MKFFSPGARQVREDIEVLLGLRTHLSKPLPPKVRPRPRPFTITADEYWGRRTTKART